MSYQNDDKWGLDSADDSIPPEIARLTDVSRYYAFANEGQNEQTTLDAEISEIIGPGPEEIASLESIKVTIAALKPFLQEKVQESRQVVQVLEIYPTGETGYKTAMTLNRLLDFIHELVVKIGGSDASHSSRDNILVAAAGGGGGAGSSGAAAAAAAAAAAESGDGSTSDVGSEQDTEASSNSKNDGSIYRSIREIQFHDLRHLENQFHTHEEPTVIVRRHAVLVSLNPLRAIVTADRLILIVPDGADALLYMLHDYMHGIVEDNDTSYANSGNLTTEVRAYKAMFSTIVAIHQQEYANVCSKVDRALNKFQTLKTITVELQETIRILKNTVSSQAIKVNAYQRLLRDLIDSPEDLALMNLSLLKDHPELYRKPLSPDIMNARDDIVELLESYLMDYNTLSTKIDFLRAQIQNTEELVSFRLDTYRNDLLVVDITLACLMVAVSVGGFVTGIFGMNIDSGIENMSVVLFWSFSAGLIVFIWLLFLWLQQRYKLSGTVAISANAKVQPSGW